MIINLFFMNYFHLILKSDSKIKINLIQSIKLEVNLATLQKKSQNSEKIEIRHDIIKLI